MDKGEDHSSNDEISGHNFRVFLVNIMPG